MTPDPRRADFLRALTGKQASFVVWKHLDRALLGRGDVDAAAPLDRAAAVTSDAVALAKDLLLATHVVSCGHVQDKRLQFFVRPDTWPQLLELDVCTQPSRGLAPWASPARMLQLATVGDAGIRRLRPGAEAVVALVYSGLSPRGADLLPADERPTVRFGLETDLPGARNAIDLLAPAPAQRPLHILLTQLDQQRWDAAAARRAFFGFVLSGLAYPAYAARRARFRVGLSRGKECLMSDLARHHARLVPHGDLDAFLRAAAVGHALATL